uniref:Protein kinase domain-containing protein n=1 Tax=Macrostomum lignano TaxID=282301 RepID=A0A1I8F846_9PLAT
AFQSSQIIDRMSVATLPTNDCTTEVKLLPIRPVVSWAMLEPDRQLLRIKYAAMSMAKTSRLAGRNTSATTRQWRNRLATEREFVEILGDGSDWRLKKMTGCWTIRTSGVGSGEPAESSASLAAFRHENIVTAVGVLEKRTTFRPKSDT